MDPRLVAECSKHAVMVRIRGQDSLGVKTLGRPFHKISGGFTTLSASGLLVDRRLGYVITSATLLAPFMQDNALRKGTVIELMTNGLSGLPEDDDLTTKWIPAKFVRLLKDDTISQLLNRFKGDNDWIAGWPRGTDASSGHLGDMDLARRDSMSANYWAGFEEVAVLQVELEPSAATNGLRNKLLALRRDQPPQVDLSLVDPGTIKRGNHLLIVASPYGILSPSVFHNCIYTSMVANLVSLATEARPLPYFDGDHDTASSSSSSLGSPSAAQTPQLPKSRTQRIKERLHSSTSPLTPSTQSCLVLIDQQCLPGCEGGPVFDSTGALIGLLAPPLRRNDGSNVEVHLVLPLYPYLSQIRDSLIAKVPILDRRGARKIDFKLVPVAAQTSKEAFSSPHSLLAPNPPPTMNHMMPDSSAIVKKTLPSVVVISTGTYWGSGVVVSSQGHLLTSAHIFRAFLADTSTPNKPVLKTGYSVDVRIDVDADPLGPFDAAKSQWHRATLIYISSSHLDVALVKLNHPPPNLSVLPIIPDHPHSQGSALVAKEALEGEPVLILGYALFGPSKRIKATITSGLISRIAHLHGVPQLIQTSAAVNKGASGGAVVDSTGRFVGLITCNAMTKEGYIIPRINFSIPAGVLAPVADFIRTGGDYGVLSAIERKDAECAALWSMSSLTDDSDTTVRPMGLPHPSGQPSNTIEPQRGTKLLEFWNHNLANLPPPAALSIPKARL